MFEPFVYLVTEQRHIMKIFGTKQGGIEKIFTHYKLSLLSVYSILKHSFSKRVFDFLCLLIHAACFNVVVFKPEDFIFGYHFVF